MIFSSKALPVVNEANGTLPPTTPPRLIVPLPLSEREKLPLMELSSESVVVNASALINVSPARVIEP